MAKKVSNVKEDLKYLGIDFQIDLVKCFIEDRTFFLNIVDIVDQNMFTDDMLRRIVGFMKDRYEKNETVANYNDLDTIIRSKVTDQISVERMIQMLNDIKEREIKRGIDLIEGESERFFKQQNLVKAINKAEDIIKTGDVGRYNDIEDLFKKALEVNNKRDMGFGIFDEFEDALSDDYRITIPTGAKELDERLCGGIGKGELGVIIAPPGIGKTSATTGFCASAATYKCESNFNNGFKVYHVFFEDSPKVIKRKYYAYLTNVEQRYLSRPDVRPEIIRMMNTTLAEEVDMIKRNIIAYRAKNNEFSPTDLRIKINQLIAKGFKPDLVVVDYFECLKLEKPETSADSEWSREGITMRKLEAIANEFDIALWVPIQGNKDSIDAAYVGMSQGGGSVKKVQIGHIVMGFARTPEQKAHNRMNLTLSKFRAGAIVGGGQMNDIVFNNGTCRFDMSMVNDTDNALDGNFAGNQKEVMDEIWKETKKSQKNS